MTNHSDMNKERLIEIAEWCENGCPERNGVVGLDMTDYEQETYCGTVCCIAWQPATSFLAHRLGVLLDTWTKPQHGLG